jgi:hypothetical protein
VLLVDGLVDDVLGEVLEVLGAVLEVLGEVLEVLGDVLELEELLELPGLVLLVDGLVLLELYGLVPDELEVPVVTRETVRSSPLVVNWTVTCVPAVRPVGMSDVPDTTVNVWRPLGVSITSCRSLDDTTVPVTVVDESLDDVVDDEVLVDDWPLCDRSLWANTGPASANDVAAARQNKRLFLISPPSWATGAGRRRHRPSGCKAGARGFTLAPALVCRYGCPGRV